jgi:hypothetical protein
MFTFDDVQTTSLTFVDKKKKKLKSIPESYSFAQFQVVK